MTLSTFHKVSPPAVYFASWSTAADPPAPEPPVIITEPEYPPTYPEPNGYMLLDTVQTRFDQRRCLNCGGSHRTWQCAEIGDMLFAR